MPRGGMREGAGNKAASQSLIDPGVEAQSYFCSVCGNGHDFKSRSHLNAHEKTASHKSKIDPEFAAVEESFFCSICGNGHDFKSRSHLIQHEKTASHKSKIDPEFAATASEEAASQSFFCSVCGTGHEFKTRSHLNRHEKSASHKRKIDPEFAVAEEAEKATNKTARDTKETDRLKNRRRTKAEIQLASRKNQ